MKYNEEYKVYVSDEGKVFNMKMKEFMWFKRHGKCRWEVN